MSNFILGNISSDCTSSTPYTSTATPSTSGEYRPDGSNCHYSCPGQQSMALFPVHSFMRTVLCDHQHHRSLLPHKSSSGRESEYPATHMMTKLCTLVRFLSGFLILLNANRTRILHGKSLFIKLMLHYTLKFDYFTEYIPILIYIAVIYTHLSLKTSKNNSL